MCTALPASRACATDWNPVPGPIRTQKLVELSTSGEGRPLASAWNCCGAFENLAPNEPAWAAAATTVADPLPRRSSQADRLSDSNPSVMSMVEDPGGVTG